MAGKDSLTREEKIIKTACNSHCGGGCLLRVHVRDGTITRIETDNGEEPQFRACLRCRSYRQRVYAPDRLKYPMKRVGERGEGKFERISWDEALNTVASELKRVSKAYGPSSVFLLSSAGDSCYLNKADLIAKLLIRAIGGYSSYWGWHSNGGGKFAALITYGIHDAQNTRDDLRNSRLIILWGWNPAVSVSNTNTSWWLAQAKEAGARIIAVDPRYSPSAAVFSHEWIPIRPGTDAAMLIAMAYVIIKENLQDQKFLDTYTIGFDRFKEYVFGKEDGIVKTPVWAEAITGVPAAVTERLAREYANTKPAALIAGISPGRTAYGEEYHRAAMTLASMTGNIGIHGGNSAELSYQGSSLLFWPSLSVGKRMKGGSNPVDAAPARKSSLAICGQFWPGWTSTARINRFMLADAILKGKAGGYPADIKLLYLVNVGYVNQYSNINKIVKALEKLEFVVAHDQFMTPTAKFADILLPHNTFLERNDITVDGELPFIGYTKKIIDSLYESKSLFEIANELAPKLGITDYNDKTDEEWLKELTKELPIPDYETFKREGVHRVKLSQPRIAFEKQIKDQKNNPFPTPSGKIELYSQQLADMANPLLPPVAKYIETWESRNDPLAKKYPLQLITSHCRRRAHNQFETIPWLREVETQAVWLNSSDANARGIKDGEAARVFNDRGEMIIPARVTERIMPGVVDIPEGAWYNPDKNGVDRGGCPNILSRDMVSPGEAYPTNTALVQVEKVRSERS